MMMNLHFGVNYHFKGPVNRTHEDENKEISVFISCNDSNKILSCIQLLLDIC